MDRTTAGNGRQRTTPTPWRYPRHASTTAAAAARRRTRTRPDLQLHDLGRWDPAEEYWGEPEDTIDAVFAEIIAAGPRPLHEMEQVIPGAEPEDLEDDIIRSSELHHAGLPRQAAALLLRMLRWDYRCVDAHAHLGNIAFDLDPERALQHYEMGVAIGEMALPDPFGGVLDWGLVDNRPFLRSLHGMGLSLWRLGRFEEAEEVMLSLLWLNPSDQQGVRFELGPVRKRVTWHEAQDTFSPPRSGGAAGSEPDSDEVWRSAEAAPILSQLRALTRFLGDGRRLTGAGNLTLGDARSLTELAATGDSMEEQIGGRISRARSAAELPGLSRLLDCARASGMVRVQRGRLRATRRGRQLAAAGELAPFFDEIAGAVMAAGPLTVVFGGRRRYFSDALDEVLDGLAPRLLLEPHAAAGPVPIAAMEARAADTLLATFAVRGPDDERRMRIAASSGVRSIYALFRLLGVVRPDELPATGPPPPDPFEEMTGTVELTAAGWAWVGRRYGTAPVPPFRSPSAG